MDAFQNSDVWAFGVRITKLFDWTAVGSLLVFLTLLQALWLANTGNRRFESQQAVVLEYVRARLMGLHIIEKITMGALNSGLDIRDISGQPMVTDLELTFGKIDRMTLPTAACMEAVEQARSALATLKGLYDPAETDGELLKALLPFTSAYTDYAIKIIEREIEDREPSFVARLVTKIRRGKPPTRPETYLGQGMRMAKEDAD